MRCWTNGSGCSKNSMARLMLDALKGREDYGLNLNPLAPLTLAMAYHGSFEKSAGKENRLSLRPPFSRIQEENSRFPS